MNLHASDAMLGPLYLTLTLLAGVHPSLTKLCNRLAGEGVLGLGSWVLGFGFWVLGFGFWVLCFGFWVLGFGFWVWSLVT